MKRRPRRSRHPGFSLIELMIGLAIGLFIVAVGSSLLVAQLRESRSLLLEARLMQDLRSAADLVARDLRRAGYWGAAARGAWTPGTGSTLAVNPYSALGVASAASDAIGFGYSRDAVENGSVDSNEVFGYRLRASTIELQLGLGNWQALTDATALVVTAFGIDPTTQEIVLDGLCARPCPAGDAACPPRQQVRSLVVHLTGRSANDASVVRSLDSEVRLRNDTMAGHCAGA